ncbi:MAG: hypothetical protein ACRCTQ_03980 [Brevinemataceae bacterium]
MKFVNLILIVLVAVCFSSCSDLTYLFWQNAQGIYQLINSTQTFSIDTSGNMAGTPDTQFMFYQAKSCTEAIYMHRQNMKNTYVSIRIDVTNLYHGEVQNNPEAVSFNNMTLFAIKISSL